MKKKERILIIDDDPAMLTYMTTLLEDHAYEVVSCHCADEALNQALESSPDLITLDLLMPGQSGILFYRRLKRHPKLGGIPVVIITGFTREQFPMVDWRRFFSGRSVPAPEGFIEKPVSPQRILETVHRILSQDKTSAGVGGG